MSTGYLAIRNDYLAKAWARGPEVLAACLPAEPDHRHLKFRAFGEDCLWTPWRILRNTPPEK